LSGLDADIVLAACFFVTFGLRALIVGERFDRALHRIDPTYRNTREMAASVLIDPVDGVKRLRRAYGRYYGVTFQPVADPEVEGLRRRAVRAWVEYAVFGVGSFLAVLFVGGLLRKVSAGRPDISVLASGLHDMAVLAALALLGIYWVRRLIQEFRDPGGSAMAALYMLGGVAAAAIAIGLDVGLPSLFA
jgi:hypothetical protein